MYTDGIAPNGTWNPNLPLLCALVNSKLRIHHTECEWDMYKLIIMNGS